MRFVLFVVLAAVLISGCIIPSNVTPTPTATTTPTVTPTVAPQCPSSCDDNNPCTVDECNSRTNFVCGHAPLFGQRTGCDATLPGCMENACSAGACIVQAKMPCCGNGVCEASENCGSCNADCNCESGTACNGTACIVPMCVRDSECDDNNTCTMDVCNGFGAGATCAHEAKTCVNNDGCCAAGCDNANDNDCVPLDVKVSGNSGNTNVRIDSLEIMSCINEVGSSEKWLALGISVTSTSVVGFDPANVTIVESYLNRTLAPRSLAETNCAENSPVVAGNYTSVSGRIYYKYDRSQIDPRNKTIVVDLGQRPRLAWTTNVG